jgi:enoyl-CoA hydratase
MNHLVTYDLSGAIARITMDDGKLNVMSPDMLDALHLAFDRAEADGAIVILSGREGIFSAGFDLKVISHGTADEQHRMLSLGAELALRVLSFPTPVVSACAGHALPMGAFLMLASDVRIGADGPFMIGLNEVAIGLTVPQFAIELARQRLTPSYFSRSLMTGQRFAPQEAAQAGYLDRVVPPEQLQQEAEAAAMALSAIDLPSHAATKKKARKEAVQAIRDAIDLELTLENARRAVERRSVPA